ncbi:MAG: hypothetical protein KBT47_08445 [Armatimonadetes bacterium]|nr:hypothetical protein [Candidatus Hippobium faecium]
MKTLKLIALCIALVCIYAAVYAGDICSVSYDSSGNMKLRAGLAIDGNITISSPAAWYFTKNDDYPYPYPGNHVEGDNIVPDYFHANSAVWPSSGRWFVSMDKGKGTQQIHYTNGVGNSPSYVKSINNGYSHDLSMMFGSTEWRCDSEITGGDYDDIYYIGGNSQPGGKFCMFRIRVTDTGGANERYYWVGDSATGSFTYYREWVADNFVNNKGKGRYGEYGEAVWTIPSENIDVYVVVTTLFDQARFEINLVNNSDTTKYVSCAMYGTPTTSDDMSLTWGQKPYANWKQEWGGDDGDSFIGWSVIYQEISPYDLDNVKYAEVNPTYMYLPGIGTINYPMIISKNSIPDRLEMYNYRWNNANVTGDQGVSRVDDKDMGDDCVDSTYYLPPKSSFINEDIQEYEGYSTKIGGEVGSFQSLAQATFDNNGDATKPDYLIIDNSSNMLQFTNDGTRQNQNKYPFGIWIDSVYAQPIAPDNGEFPVETYWPGNEAGVQKPYETTLDKSKTWPYIDQFVDPLSYMAVWGSKPITKGKSRQIVTYYGLGGKSFINGQMNNSTFKRHNHTLLVESPTVLGFQVTKDEFGTDTLRPDTFGIKPIVTNQGMEKSYYDFRVNKVTVSLPDGLELYDNYDNDGAYFAKSENPEDSDNTWYVDKAVTVGKSGVYDKMLIRVKANGLYSGSLKYTVKIDGVDVSGGDAWSQTVEREILVPATKHGYIFGGPGNLLANPFKNVTVAGSTGETPFTVTDVYGADAAGFYWDASKQKYVAFSDLDIFRYNPQGYWILKGFDEDSDNIFTYDFPKFLKPNDVNYGDIEDSKYYMSEMTISLEKEWNIVSNPYIYPMQWTSVTVKNKTNGDIKSLEDAVEAGWLYRTLFSWEPLEESNGSFYPELSKYVAHNTVSTQLIPNKGYWVYATKPLELYFKPMMYPDSKIYDDDYYTDPDKFFRMGYRTDENYDQIEDEDVVY